MNEIITLPTQAPEECHDITEQIAEVVERSGVKSGLCHVMVLHSTAAIVLNETHDPNIGVDVITAGGIIARKRFENVCGSHWRSPKENVFG